MNRSLLVTLSALSLITACSSGNGFSEDKSENSGGGGGGGGSGGNAEINSSNAPQVTKAAYESSEAASSASDYSGGSGLISSGPGPVAKLDGSFATANEPSASTASVPIPPTDEACPEGGITTLSGDIADPITPTLTPGDFFDLAFVSCDDGFAVIDGSLLYEVEAFSGVLSTGIYDLTMATTLTNFQIATAEDTLVSNGDVLVRLNTLAVPLVTTELSGTSLNIDGNLGSQSLTNFSSTFSQDPSTQPSPYTKTSSGTLDTTLLSGAVSYSTPVDFTGFDADYPSTGEFLVTGENSSARLVVVDNVTINIEVDSDGDGVVDDTIETTWAEFDAL